MEIPESSSESGGLPLSALLQRPSKSFCSADVETAEATRSLSEESTRREDALERNELYRDLDLSRKGKEGRRKTVSNHWHFCIFDCTVRRRAANAAIGNLRAHVTCTHLYITVHTLMSC